MFYGEMSEWFKVHDSKSCVEQSTGGSNPPLSATEGGRRFFNLVMLVALGLGEFELSFFGKYSF